MWTRNPSNGLGCIMTKETWIKVGLVSSNVYRGPDGEFWQVWVDNDPFVFASFSSFFWSLCHVFGKHCNDNSLPYRLLYVFYTLHLHSYLFRFRLPKFATLNWTHCCPAELQDYVTLFSLHVVNDLIPYCFTKHIWTEIRKKIYITYKTPQNNTMISR